MEMPMRVWTRKINQSMWRESAFELITSEESRLFTPEVLFHAHFKLVLRPESPSLVVGAIALIRWLNTRPL